MNRVIGIIGGMGPLATCDLMTKMIHFTDADTDQQHVRLCVDSNTNIPDRTEAILHNGADPVPEMVKSALRLQGMGAQVLVMSCNTAHYFYDEVVKFVEIPFLNMIDQTALYLQRKGVERAAVLATDGTRDSGIFERAFQKAGIQTIYPSREHQKVLMSLVYDYVKAGNFALDELPLWDIIHQLRESGAQQLVLGCTELPLAFQKIGCTEGVVDPTEILALSTLHFVGAKVKKEFDWE